MADYGFQVYNAAGEEVTRNSSNLFPCDVIDTEGLGAGGYKRSYSLGDREYLVVKQAIASKITGGAWSYLKIANNINISGGNLSFNIQESVFPGFGGGNQNTISTLHVYKKGNV